MNTCSRTPRLISLFQETSEQHVVDTDWLLPTYEDIMNMILVSRPCFLSLVPMSSILHFCYNCPVNTYQYLTLSWNVVTMIGRLIKPKIPLRIKNFGNRPYNHVTFYGMMFHPHYVSICLNIGIECFNVVVSIRFIMSFDVDIYIYLYTILHPKRPMCRCLCAMVAHQRRAIQPNHQPTIPAMRR